MVGGMQKNIEMSSHLLDEGCRSEQTILQVIQPICRVLVSALLIQMEVQLNTVLLHTILSMFKNFKTEFCENQKDKLFMRDQSRPHC